GAGPGAPQRLRSARLRERCGVASRRGTAPNALDRLARVWSIRYSTNDEPEQDMAPEETPDANPLGLFGRYLSVWVALSIAAGVALGASFPSLFEAVAALEFASVNLVVAVFIWVMIFPMMVQVDLAC